MTDRRPVRVDARFLEMLDRQLGQDRGPRGELTVTDFLVVDLPEIIEVFATRFESLNTPFPGRPEYRTLLPVGYLVERAVVTGCLDPDGTVVLLEVFLDLEAGW